MPSEPKPTFASPHFRIERLADGVYGAIATQSGAATSNAGIVDLGESTLVFDTFLTPKAGADLRATAEQLTGRPPTLVVNSHYHNDHIRGNQHFAGASIVATRRTAELLRTKGEEELSSERTEAAPTLELYLTGQRPKDRDYDFWVNYLRAILESLPEVRIQLPTVLFEGRLSVSGTRRTAEVLSYGGGHTGSDAFVFLPEEKVAFLGDLLFVRHHPYLGDGEPGELARTLARVEELEPRILVPGHGPVGDLEDLRSNRRYVEELTSLARDAVEQGRTQDEAATIPIPPAFAEWSYQRFFAANMRFLWAQAKRPA